MKQGNGQQNFVKRTQWSQQTPFSNNSRDKSTQGHHQMVNTKISQNGEYYLTVIEVGENPVYK